MDNVEKLYVCFDIEETADIDKARKIYVDATEDILARINSNEQIRPHLDHYPFTAKGIITQIGFNKIDPKHPISNQVELVGMGNGIIYYASAEYPFGPYEREYTEPYEDAKRIVMESK